MQIDSLSFVIRWWMMKLIAWELNFVDAKQWTVTSEHRKDVNEHTLSLLLHLIIVICNKFTNGKYTKQWTMADTDRTNNVIPYPKYVKLNGQFSFSVLGAEVKIKYKMLSPILWIYSHSFFLIRIAFVSCESCTLQSGH